MYVLLFFCHFIYNQIPQNEVFQTKYCRSNGCLMGVRIRSLHDQFCLAGIFLTETLLRQRIISEKWHYTSQNICMGVKIRSLHDQLCLADIFLTETLLRLCIISEKWHYTSQNICINFKETFKFWLV